MARIFNKSERKAKLREDHKAWLNTIARTDGRSLTAIARDAGLDPSALTRFMHDEERGSTLDTLTIAAVMDETGAPAPFEQAVQQVARRGLGEAESEPYEPSTEEMRLRCRTATIAPSPSPSCVVIPGKDPRDDDSIREAIRLSGNEPRSNRSIDRL